MKRIAVLAVLIFFGGRIGAQAGEVDLRSTALVEGAKKEGKVVLYTSVETEFARALTSAFEAKYPKIQTDIFRSTHEKIFSRMNVERQTGTYTADVISVGEFERLAVCTSDSWILANPKSRTLTLPSGLSLTFAGFKSR